MKKIKFISFCILFMFFLLPTSVSVKAQDAVTTEVSAQNTDDATNASLDDAKQLETKNKKDKDVFSAPSS